MTTMGLPSRSAVMIEPIPAWATIAEASRARRSNSAGSRNATCSMALGV
ncbi:MAG: hypothetical protein KatS3mg103_0385 [Phycisphaerales bacterium]|nr:MAG: hypothetical protein KatS3mg103_0385 [Phycisphaerales bacterium]